MNRAMFVPEPILRNRSGVRAKTWRSPPIRQIGIQMAG
jgi:hypothetical protein